MDAFEAVRTVLAVREFADKPLPAAVVRRIVEAAHLTASAANRQPWHFLVVDDRETLRRLGELASSGTYIAQAPLAVVVIIEETPFAVSDASRAIQSMALAAWSEGVGSNWVGFSHKLDQVKAPLGIPETLGVLAIVPFGYPVTPGGEGKKKRKPLAEIASRNRYGEPFAEKL